MGADVRAQGRDPGRAVSCGADPASTRGSPGADRSRFGFSSGHERGYADYKPGSDPNRGVVRLADYWILVIPLWPILLLVSGPFALWLTRWYRRSRQNQAGFEVVAAQPPAT